MMSGVFIIKNGKKQKTSILNTKLGDYVVILNRNS